ncbi:MAG: tRNA pseudouridine(55) synthase TruB [Candidatus Acididesulfobacter diazotrophicus]|uniref:tRNA pseudouridine synthase B n=1 Tax=Candidatus Acididesulfobacter diazotrophicus TaxID=2597226 RepID=A0A519BNP4_9DELT|nr:MAG: tRNA pseudouridine(55) synthase TruB [Candidatus Acididesulfobacter diazotrophicus]
MNTAEKFFKSGLLIIDKPSDISSFGVDSFIKKTLNCKKVGHAGTIDPFATGVLPVLINNATKLQDKFLNMPKSYEGTFKCGEFTDTLDASGKIVIEKEITDDDVVKIAKYLQDLKGDIIQKAPLYSAKKYKGIAFYKYARKNENNGSNELPDEIVNKTSAVHIYQFEIKSIEGFFINFMCKVSKGTYIRAFAQDILDKFNLPMSLISLRRTNAGGYDISNAIPFKDIEKGKDFIISNLINVNLT